MQTITQFDKTILVVEPIDNSRLSLLNFLNAHYFCDEADSVSRAFEKIGRNNFDIVVSNFELGEINAFELLSSIQFISPDTTVILYGENTSANDVIESFRAGAFDFLQKPFEFEEVEESIERAIIRYKTKQLKEGYEKRLATMLSEKSFELDRALNEVKNSYHATLKVLIQALEARDRETHGHSERVVTFSLRLAHELGLEEKQMRDLELGALLHDIGKITIPDEILKNPDKLTESQWEKVKHHPTQGFEFLQNIPFLSGAAKIVAEHHERWDGKGYPNQLRGDEISFISRIFSVADAFDAMISEQIYSESDSFEIAAEELEQNAGSQFDPVVIEAFKKIPKEDWTTLDNRSRNEMVEIFSSDEIVSDLATPQDYLELVH